MLQLECRFYPRAEIAEVLSVCLEDSKHFAEKVKSTLMKWGYGFEYSRNGVLITKVPETPEAKLREILIRELNLDIQINAYAFSCFLCAFSDLAGFDSMPWEERAVQLHSHYGVTVTDRTLRNWCSKMIGSNIIQKQGNITYWKTEWIGKKKCRTVIAPDDVEMAEYFQMKKEYLSVQEDWKNVYKRLWEKYNCCFYCCKGLVFNAIEEDYFMQIHELTQEILAKHIDSPKEIKRKEDFDAQWFSV